MEVKKPFLMKGNRERRLRYATFPRTGLKISGSRSFRVTNPNVRFCHQYVPMKSAQRYNSEFLQQSVKHSGGVSFGISASDIWDVEK